MLISFGVAPLFSSLIASTYLLKLEYAVGLSQFPPARLES